MGVNQSTLGRRRLNSRPQTPPGLFRQKMGAGPVGVHFSTCKKWLVCTRQDEHEWLTGTQNYSGRAKSQLLWATKACPVMVEASKPVLATEKSSWQKQELGTSIWDLKAVSWGRWGSPVSTVRSPLLTVASPVPVTFGFVTFAMNALIIILIWQLLANTTVWQQMENGTIQWCWMSQVVFGGHIKPHRTWETLSICANAHGRLDK